MILGQVMLLAPVSASHDSDCTVNGIIFFVKSTRLKQCATELFGYVMLLMLLSVSSMVPLHSLGQDDLKKRQCDFFVHVMPFMPVSVACNASIRFM